MVPIPPVSQTPVEPDQSGREVGQFTPLWMLLFAILLLAAGVSLLVSRPVGQWVAAQQPTSTSTPAPALTATASPSPAPTRVPTRTPTIIPTEARESARSSPKFDLVSDLRWIQMFDRLNGWGIGQYALWHTRDGGQTWRDVTPASVFPELPGVAAYFINSQKAWYFDSNGAVDFSGRLFYTENRGRTWTSRETWFGGEAPRLFFLEENVGWVLTNSYNFTRELYRTSNSGIDWSAYHRVERQLEGRNGFLPETGFLRGPVFLNPDHGWIGGTTWIQDGSSFIYESTDGGRLWMLRPLPMDEGFSSMWISAPLFFGADQNQGVMVAYSAPTDEIVEFQGNFNENQFGVTPVDLEGARYVFFSTQDQGENWAETSWVEISNPSPFSLPTTEYFFVLDRFTLHFTQDAGKTWKRIETNLEDLTGGDVQITAMQFVDEKAGWVWGLEINRMHLYQTLDGGLNWKEINLER